MRITLTTENLSKLLIEASRMGAKEVLIEAGRYNDEISQRRAWSIYGRGIIESMRLRGLISRNQGDGRNAKIMYKRSEIDAVIQAEKLQKWL